jgi:glycosyltransferase involved in cell wall biosynthesis
MGREPKIFIWKGGWRGGVEKTALMLAEAFKKYHGLEPVLGVFERREEVRFSQIEIRRAFPEKLAGYNSAWATFFLNMGGFLEKFDIVYSHSGFFLKRNSNFYVCYEAGDLDSLFHNLPILSRVVAFPILQLHLSMMKKADLVIVPFDELGIFLRRHGIDQYKVWPASSVDTKRFRPLKLPRGEKFRLLFVGRPRDPRKNLSILLRVCQKLRDQVELYVVGDREKTVKGNVSFLGEIGDKELVSQYQRCDLYVLPSFWEGLPRTLLEAMACGRPALVSTNAVGKTLRRYVITFDPFSEEDLEKKIRWIMENYEEVEKLAREGCKFVRKNFEHGRVIKGMTDLILRGYEEWKG